MIDQASTLRSLATARIHTQPGTHVRRWTITSGKGGVGKSVIALNLALNLSYMGCRVLLVDADENLGKLDVMLGVSPMYRVSDVMNGTATMDEALMNPYSNLFLLAGSSGSANYSGITSKEQTSFIERVNRSEKHITDIIFDTGAGIHDGVIKYAAMAHNLVVVSNPEPVAILDAYAAMKMTTLKNSYVSLHLIMNGRGSPSECDEAAAKLQTAVKHFLLSDMNYLGFVPHDETVTLSIMKQSPLAKSYPASAAALCIQAISRRLYKEHSMTTTQEQMVLV